MNQQSTAFSLPPISSMSSSMLNGEDIHHLLSSSNFVTSLMNQTKKDDTFTSPPLLSNQVQISSMEPGKLNQTPTPTISQPISQTLSVQQPKKEKKPSKKKKEPSANASYSGPSLGVPNTIKVPASSNVPAKRLLELDAYSAVVSAFKSQGELTWKKETILQDLRGLLHISDERHKMELRRAEETIPSSLTGRRKYDEDLSPMISDDDSEYDDDGRPRKRTRKPDLDYMTAAPLPNSDPYSVSKLAKAAKGNGKKKRTPKAKVDANNAVDFVPLSSAENSNQSAPSEDIHLPLDSVQMKMNSDRELENLKNVLEQQRAQLQIDLAKMQQPTPQ